MTIAVTTRGTCAMHDFYGDRCGKPVAVGKAHCRACQRDADERAAHRIARDRAIAVAVRDRLYVQTINDV